MTVSIRTTTTADTDALVELADGTGVFHPHEIVALREVLDDYHAMNQADGHVGRTGVENERIIGFVYYAPVAMTDNTWEMWWLAVDKALQGHGHGRTLVEFAEQDVRERGGRLLLIETSSTPHYQPTRQFYLKNGYRQVAQIPDFYHDGDDKVIFAKKLDPN